MTDRVHKHTIMQAEFLRALFAEAKGDFRRAMDLAGYSKGVDIMQVARNLRSDIIELAEVQLALNAPKAAMAFGDVMDSPETIGAKEKIACAREILDRVGLAKVEKSKITHEIPNALFILPAKEPTKANEVGESST